MAHLLARSPSWYPRSISGIHSCSMRSMTRVLTVLAFALTLSAQTTTSSIVGTVTDPSGAVVPSVTITVLNTATGIRSQTTTDSVGNYTVGQLPPGDYEVSGEIAGF